MPSKIHIEDIVGRDIIFFKTSFIIKDPRTPKISILEEAPNFFVIIKEAASHSTQVSMTFLKFVKMTYCKEEQQVGWVIKL